MLWEVAAAEAHQALAVDDLRHLSLPVKFGCLDDG